MGDDLFAYIERLQLMAFFAGYPLLYAMAQVLAGLKVRKQGSFPHLWVRSLPYAYALTATLFLGMLIRDLYPDYTLNHITSQFQNPWLKVVGIMAVLCWLPFFSRKPLLCLLHSLVFFYFVLRDLFFHFTSSSVGREIIQNDMKILTDSLLLNAVTMVLVMVVLAILSFKKAD